MQFTMGDQKKELTVQLSTAIAMQGRIVGPHGEAVPFAWVYPDTWRGKVIAKDLRGDRIKTAIAAALGK
jgi:hypothetical protein